MRDRVSRGWAGKICKELGDLGILGHKMIRPRRQKNDTEHYFLRTDMDAFLALARLILIDNPVLSYSFLMHRFVQKQISTEFVGDILSIKSVESGEEEEKIILPILALIQISRAALSEFLFGEWAPHDEPDGTQTIDHLMFKLMFLAIGELAAYRGVPEDSIVKDAWIRHGNRLRMDEEEALLGILLKDGRVVYFDGGFDTTHDYYGDGEYIYEIETNPENCTMKSWVKKLV